MSSLALYLARLHFSRGSLKKLGVQSAAACCCLVVATAFVVPRPLNRVWSARKVSGKILYQTLNRDLIEATQQGKAPLFF
jgi:hypothetical protein